MSHRAYHLLSNNIFRNLAFEATLHDNMQRVLRTLPMEPSSPTTCKWGHTPSLPLEAGAIPTQVLLLWRDTPCVVIGRHQCTWRELNMPRLRQLSASGTEVAVARRPSGGGAVFHDLGNWCVSVLMPRPQYNRAIHMDWLAACVRRSLKEHPLNNSSSPRPEHVTAAPRGDIFVREDLKVSGSASKLASHAAYHHATILSNANLGILSSVLKPSFNLMYTKATESVRSSVINLYLDNAQWPSVLAEEYGKKIASHDFHVSQLRFVEVPEGQEEAFVNGEAFHAHLKEFQSWEWNFARSPAFTVHLPLSPDSLLRISYHCVKGRLARVFLSTAGEGGEGEEVQLANSSLAPVAMDLSQLHRAVQHADGVMRDCLLKPAEIRSRLHEAVLRNSPHDRTAQYLLTSLSQFSDQI